MKTTLAFIFFLITCSVSAQVFEYNNYCYGTQIDSCKQIINHATCHPTNGIVLFFSHKIAIDSITFYVYSVDTLENKNKLIYYTAFSNSPRNGEPASIIRDDNKKIVTLITLTDKIRMVLNLDYYMHVEKNN